MDAKLLLPCVAAERGFSPILGSHKSVAREILRFPRGIYFAKDLTRAKRSIFKILRQLGYVIVACDEESLVRFPQRDFFRRRLSPKSAPYLSHVFAWGEDDAEEFRAYPPLAKTPIHATGNPRLDLLRPEIRRIFEADADEIRTKYGPFILINTRFTHVNNWSAAKNRKGIDAGREEAEFSRGNAEHQEALLAHYSKMIPALASAFPNFTIVIRPHPRENHETWIRSAEGKANVRVVQEKGVAPWLMAASAMIHNGCTTAVEAAVLGRMPIAFRPIAKTRYDHELPNGLSIQTHDLSELGAAVRKVVAGQRIEDDEGSRRAILERHVSACTGPLAADRIVDVLVEAARELAFETGRVDPRFPGTSESELAERIAQLSAQLGRFDGLSVHRIDEQVFRVDGRSG